MWQTLLLDFISLILQTIWGDWHFISTLDMSENVSKKVSKGFEDK